MTLSHAESWNQPYDPADVIPAPLVESAASARGRRLAGALAGTVVALALIVWVGWGISQWASLPGPGVVSLGLHTLAALTAIVLQRIADRRGGARGWLIAGVQAVILWGLVASQWWSGGGVI